jgi:hypothetical protein
MGKYCFRISGSFFSPFRIICLGGKKSLGIIVAVVVEVSKESYFPQNEIFVNDHLFEVK